MNLFLIVKKTLNILKSIHSHPLASLLMEQELFFIVLVLIFFYHKQRMWHYSSKNKEMTWTTWIKQTTLSTKYKSLHFKLFHKKTQKRTSTDRSQTLKDGSLVMIHTYNCQIQVNNEWKESQTQSLVMIKQYRKGCIS